VGGNLFLHGGNSEFGNAGNVEIVGGSSKLIENGGVVMKSGGGSSYVSVSDHNVDSYGEKISLVTSYFNASTSTRTIGLGHTLLNNSTSYDLQLQSGLNSSLIVATSPLQVTLVQYSSDMRIKDDIESVDEEALLSKLMKLKIRSYRYTDEWRGVRKDIEDVRVRGIIAQELAEVFPEYVTVVPEYNLPDKNVSFKNFHQVDKTSLILDTIASLQALSRRLSLSPNAQIGSSDVKLSTGSTFVQNSTSGELYIETGASQRDKSGNVTIRTGNSTSLAGSINLVAGTSIYESGGSINIFSGESKLGHGGAIKIRSGNGASSGNVFIETGNSGENISGNGNIALTTSNTPFGFGSKILMGSASNGVKISSGESQLNNGENVELFAGVKPERTNP
jgi:hypothetical protein